MNYNNEIITGDCLEVLRQLPDQIFQSCITSPPYWGLRDYGVDGQLGLESTPEEYTAKMVEIFREVRRTLRDDGTLWLNLGDTYSAHKDCKSVSQTLAIGGKNERAHVIEKGKSVSRNSRIMKSIGLKNKDLIGIPWMVAFALRNDGWYLRCDIIWSKPNPMPESVTDRPTKAHEYVFLMSKSQRYYYDADAISELASYPQFGYKNASAYNGKNSKQDALGDRRYTGFNERWRENPTQTRNARSVWEIPTQPYPEAHFATYPEKLVNKCILAGTKEGDLILDPFAGSCTTGYRAKEMRRKFTMIELKPEYVKLGHRRMQQEVLI